MQYPVFKEQMVSCLFVQATAWRRPTLPAPCGASTIGAGGLNGRVRYGNGCVPSAIITRQDIHFITHAYVGQAEKEGNAPSKLNSEWAFTVISP